MGSKPKPVKAPKADYAADISKFVSAYGGALPQVLGFERQFRPEFQALNLQDISGFLGGTGGQQGLFGLSRRATEEAQRQIESARAAELGGMTGQAGLTRGLMQSLSPEQARSVELQRQAAERAQGLESEFQATSQPYTGMFGTMAQEAFARRGTLSPEEQRMSQQQAREASVASGRLGGNAAIAAEIQNREAAKAARRQEAVSMGGLAQQQMMQTEAQRAALRGEAQAAGQGLYGLAQGFYTSPGLALLSQQPLSYQTGQGMLGLGMGGMKQGTPGLINPDMGLNLGAAERQNALNASAATQQARASYSSGLFGGLGGLAQGVGTAAAAAIPFMMSDKRLKTDIEKVGKTNAGLPIYTYKYKGDNKTQMGVMAQDVEKKTPKAVKEVGGFKAVNYALVK